MGEDVWLRSNEANIQLSGSVNVNKANDIYLLSGTLQAPRGTYRLILGPVTREFVVRQGTVRYFGTPDLDAELNIQATHTVHPLPGPGQYSEIPVRARITGSLRLPKLTLESDYGYTQTELLSYLISGKRVRAGTNQGAFSVAPPLPGAGDWAHGRVGPAKRSTIPRFNPAM
jgi:autotransporter translocation and assembly factor TamB